jgi:hypothetical protein
LCILFRLHILNKTKILLNHLQETENIVEECQLKQINSANNLLLKTNQFCNQYSTTCIFTENNLPYNNNNLFLDLQSTTLFKGISTYKKRTCATNHFQKEKRMRLESTLE